MSETLIIAVTGGAIGGYFIGHFLGFTTGWNIGRRKLIEWHNRNQEIAREAAQDPQVQAALDELR